jgi:hypothetical protein
LSLTLPTVATERVPDFRNFAYPWADEADFVPSTWKWLPLPISTVVRLANGRFEFPSEGYPWPASLYFKEVTTGNLGQDAPKAAAITLSYGTGGTANWSYLYVYELSKAPRLLGILRSGSRADGGLIEVKIDHQLLILKFADPARRTADCCSDGFIRERYKWNGAAFTEVGAAERGDAANPNPEDKNSHR